MSISERSIIIFLSACLSGLCAPVLPAPQRYDLTAESIEISTIWQASNWTDKTVNMTSWNYNTMLTSFQGNSYLVYVDEDRRPRVVKIDAEGLASSAYLDSNENDVYRSRNDGHHTFSIGVDEAGYIHVSGDMHGYPSKGAVNHLPDRYNSLKTKAYCMYWRSDKPADISSFSWLGSAKERSPQGEYFSYMAFVNDANGKLYYYSRQRRNNHRQMLWVASRYAVASGPGRLLGARRARPIRCP